MAWNFEGVGLRGLPLRDLGHGVMMDRGLTKGEDVPAVPGCAPVWTAPLVFSQGYVAMRPHSSARKPAP